MCIVLCFIVFFEYLQHVGVSAMRKERGIPFIVGNAQLVEQFGETFLRVQFAVLGCALRIKALIARLGAARSGRVRIDEPERKRDDSLPFFPAHLINEFVAFERYRSGVIYVPRVRLVDRLKERQWYLIFPLEYLPRRRRPTLPVRQGARMDDDIVRVALADILFYYLLTAEEKSDVAARQVLWVIYGGHFVAAFAQLSSEFLRIRHEPTGGVVHEKRDKQFFCCHSS